MDWSWRLRCRALPWRHGASAATRRHPDLADGPGRGDQQVVRPADRRRSRRHLHAEHVAVHHQARSVPRDPARPPALPAQVPARAGLRAADRRRRRQHRIHRRRSQLARRSGRLVRRLPRPAARLGRLRRRRGHAPDSRDAPHLFGLGLQEMLADEITDRLCARSAPRPSPTADRDEAAVDPRAASPRASTSAPSPPTPTAPSTPRACVGVNPDLRVRPFFAQGGTISIREFLVGAFNAEMGLESADPDLLRAAARRRASLTPSGMVLDGALDAIESAAGRPPHQRTATATRHRQRDPGEPSSTSWSSTC